MKRLSLLAVLAAVIVSGSALAVVDVGPSGSLPKASNADDVIKGMNDTVNKLALLSKEITKMVYDSKKREEVNAKLAQVKQ